MPRGGTGCFSMSVEQRLLHVEDSFHLEFFSSVEGSLHGMCMYTAPSSSTTFCKRHQRHVGLVCMFRDSPISFPSVSCPFQPLPSLCLCPVCDTYPAASFLFFSRLSFYLHASTSAYPALFFFRQYVPLHLYVCIRGWKSISTGRPGPLFLHPAFLLSPSLSPSFFTSSFLSLWGFSTQRGRWSQSTRQERLLRV